MAMVSGLVYPLYSFIQPYSVQYPFLVCIAVRNVSFYYALATTFV